MEAQVQQLNERVWSLNRHAVDDQRIMIAISGCPGSGKTTLATQVVKSINTTINRPLDASAMLLSLDGYHLTRAQLDRMDDPILAHARRGAAFTFDARGFLDVVLKLRQPIVPDTEMVLAPSFDHSIKDPAPNASEIASRCRIIVLEGNYLSLGSAAPEWRQAAELMDELWFVNVSEAVARNRLIERHLGAGIASTSEEAVKRVEQNDLVNGREIVARRLPVHLVLDGGN